MVAAERPFSRLYQCTTSQSINIGIKTNENAATRYFN